MLRCFVVLFQLATLGMLLPTAAQEPDPYANEPYWYQPGHPVEPAEESALRTLPGFVAERILTVPREFGSWTALTVDPKGRIIAAAQHQRGLFRVTLPSPDRPEEPTRLERMTGAAAGIGWAHGLLYAFDGLYVTVAEEGDVETGVHRLQDTNGDGDFDRSTLLFKLQGAGEHGPHQIVVGPDQRSLYMMVGNGSPVPDDLTVRRAMLPRGFDRVMPPGFEHSRPSAQGWVLRFSPEGHERELFCSGLRNPYDLAFNRQGELFTFDSDDEWDLGTPWYRPTRIVHLVSGGEYGWRGGGAVWPDHAEDSIGPVINLGPGSPTGIAFGYGSSFPQRYAEALFVGDWTFGAIHAVFLRPEGTGFIAEAEEFLSGTGLPVTDFVFGPDGALYVTVGGRRLGSALYRIRYTGTSGAEASARASPATLPATLRRELERWHGRPDPRALDAAWPHLAHPDRLVRFAARVAVETQPVEQWRERVWQERRPLAQQMAWLALARQGEAEDLHVLLEEIARAPWAERAPDQHLRRLRALELALARQPAPPPLAARLVERLRPLFAAPDVAVTRETARLLGLLGDTGWVAEAQQLMAKDEGTRPSQGLDAFIRNPKYGQALREMLEAPPLVDRMHHAQMLLWILPQMTPEQRQTYFELIGDAMVHSRGGHLYLQFWERIRDAALERVPVPERPRLAELAAAPVIQDEPLPTPTGPGREWTVDEVVPLAAGAVQRGRNFERGQQMYAAASCRTCHRLAGEGGVMGPSLAGVGDRFTLRDIIEAIIEPSRAISDQYRMVFITTRDGQAVSGRVVSKDAQFTRVAPNLLRPSQLVTIENEQIGEETFLQVSTMPPGLINALNEEEVLDLLAYLLSGGDPGHAVYR